jgi:hypothetical protein
MLVRVIFVPQIPATGLLPASYPQQEIDPQETGSCPQLCSAAKMVPGAKQLLNE